MNHLLIKKPSSLHGGFAWSAVERWTPQIINFLSLVLLARLLDPNAFGLMATAAIFIAACSLIIDQGMTEALVQKRTVDNADYSTVFWLNLGVAAVCSGVLFASAGSISRWFEMPGLKSLIEVLSFSPLIGAASKVHQAILRRALEFKGLAERRVISSVAGATVGLSAAFLGCGPMSLVFRQIGEELVSCVVLWRVTSWRPSLTFSIQRLKGLLGFGSSILVLSLLTVLNTRIDDLAISMGLGAIALGIYSVAYSFLRAINAGFNGVILRVAYSHFCRHQDNCEELERVFRQTFRVSVYSGFIVFGLLAVGADDIVATVFGNDWSAAGPVMAVLAIGAFFQLPSSFILVYLRSIGLPHLHMLFLAMFVLILAVGVFSLVHLGVMMVAWVVTAVTVLGSFGACYLGVRVSIFRMSWINASLLRGTIAAALACGLAFVTRSLLSSFDSWFRLVCVVASSLIGYMIALMILDRQFQSVMLAIPSKLAATYRMR